MVQACFMSLPLDIRARIVAMAHNADKRYEASSCRFPVSPSAGRPIKQKQLMLALDYEMTVAEGKLDLERDGETIRLSRLLAATDEGSLWYGRSLYALSLTCKEMRALCLPRIFRVLRAFRSTRASFTDDIFMKHRAQFRCVSFRKWPSVWDEMVSPIPELSESAVIDASLQTLDILHHFPALEQLDFDWPLARAILGLNSSAALQADPELPPVNPTFVMERFQLEALSPKITTLVLRDMPDAFATEAVLRFFRHLRHLDLHREHIALPYGFPPASLAALPLESLTLVTCNLAEWRFEHWASSAASWTSRTSLRRLELTLISAEKTEDQSVHEVVAHEMRFINCFAPTLEELHITFFARQSEKAPESVLSPFEMQQFPKLRRISLSCAHQRDVDILRLFPRSPTVPLEVIIRNSARVPDIPLDDFASLLTSIPIIIDDTSSPDQDDALTTRAQNITLKLEAPHYSSLYNTGEVDELPGFIQRRIAEATRTGDTMRLRELKSASSQLFDLMTMEKL